MNYSFGEAKFQQTGSGRFSVRRCWEELYKQGKCCLCVLAPMLFISSPCWGLLIQNPTDAKLKLSHIQLFKQLPYKQIFSQLDSACFAHSAKSGHTQWLAIDKPLLLLPSETLTWRLPILWAYISQTQIPSLISFSHRNSFALLLHGDSCTIPPDRLYWERIFPTCKPVQASPSKACCGLLPHAVFFFFFSLICSQILPAPLSLGWGSNRS